MLDKKHEDFVVDDEAVIAQTLAIILNQAGFHATALDHPEKAMAAQVESAPDPQISDVMMPGMTGVECIDPKPSSRLEKMDLEFRRRGGRRSLTR